jgi:hypothetical protein
MADLCASSQDRASTLGAFLQVGFAAILAELLLTLFSGSGMVHALSDRRR